MVSTSGSFQSARLLPFLLLVLFPLAGCNKDANLVVPGATEKKSEEKPAEQTAGTGPGVIVSPSSSGGGSISNVPAEIAAESSAGGSTIPIIGPILDLISPPTASPSTSAPATAPAAMEGPAPASAPAAAPAAVAVQPVEESQSQAGALVQEGGGQAITDSSPTGMVQDLFTNLQEQFEKLREQFTSKQDSVSEATPDPETPAKNQVPDGFYADMRSECLALQAGVGLISDSRILDSQESSDGLMKQQVLEESKEDGESAIQTSVASRSQTIMDRAALQKIAGSVRLGFEVRLDRISPRAFYFYDSKCSRVIPNLQLDRLGRNSLPVAYLEELESKDGSSTLVVSISGFDEKFELQKIALNSLDGVWAIRDCEMDGDSGQSRRAAAYVQGNLLVQFGITFSDSGCSTPIVPIEETLLEVQKKLEEGGALISEILPSKEGASYEVRLKESDETLILLERMGAPEEVQKNQYFVFPSECQKDGIGGSDSRGVLYRDGIVYGMRFHFRDESCQLGDAPTEEEIQKALASVGAKALLLQLPQTTEEDLKKIEELGYDSILSIEGKEIKTRHLRVTESDPTFREEK